MRTGYGPKIRTLLGEAENERMHLMTFIEISKPNTFERTVVLIAQAIFWHVYFVIYVFFPRTAHRIVGYFEEEAVYSYTEYLREIDEGRIDNIAAPKNCYRLLEVVGKRHLARCGHRGAQRRGRAPRRQPRLRRRIRPWRLVKHNSPGPAIQRQQLSILLLDMSQPLQSPSCSVTESCPISSRKKANALSS